MAGARPLSEAGVYGFELDRAALGELEQLAADPALPRALDGPLESGSGRYVVRLGANEPLRWSPFTAPPAPLAALADRLRALLGEARSHPVAAVRLDIDAEAGEPLALAFRFSALGHEPLQLTVGPLWARVVETPSAPSGPPPLAWASEAAPVAAEAGGPVTLAPGETFALRATTSAPQGHLRVDGFADVTVDRAAAGDPAEAHLEATLGAGPAAVEVR